VLGTIAVASLQLDPLSGRFRIRFSFGEQEYKRSLKTKEESVARATLGRVEETIRLMEQGRIEIPANIDIGRFILSDGKRHGKIVVQRVMSLNDVIARYQEALPNGAKEGNTITTEKLHCKHFRRILTEQIAMQALSTADLQRYAEKRSQEKGRRGKVRPQTIKKELDTFRVIWNWAVSFGFLTGPAPIKGVKFAKAKEQMPFQTWDEIQRTIDRGGLAAAEQKEVWDCLFLTTPQIEEVLCVVEATAQQPLVYPMFVLAAHTGARRSEMMRSRIDDFDFESKTVLIREKKKDKSTQITYRRVPMSPLLVQVMSAWFCQHPGGSYTFCLTPNEMLKQTFTTKCFRRSLKGSKWVRLRGFHVFRHSFASNLAAKGIDQRVIDEFMGHQTEAMRKRYRHFFPDQRQKTIELVFGQNGK
jgi:integrase